MEVFRDIIKQAADRLWAADQSLVPCDPIRDLIPAQDITSAYAVQHLNVDRQAAAGRYFRGVD
jgi:2-keto-4-pentenoate hydratase